MAKGTKEFKEHKEWLELYLYCFEDGCFILRK